MTALLSQCLIPKYSEFNDIEQELIIETEIYLIPCAYLLLGGS